jgi:transposase-like protein
VWSAVDVDSKELLALEASYGRSSLNALSFLKKALKMCTNKPLVIVDSGPWYRWAVDEARRNNLPMPEPPELPTDLVMKVSNRYIEAYERMTGERLR